MEYTHDVELPQQRELFDDAFPANKGTMAGSIAHFQWKFRQSPFSPTSYAYVATEDNQMLGYYAAIPYRYRIGDRDVSVGMVCDVMTHSHARRRGVFTNLGKFAIQELQAANVEFLTGYPVTWQVINGHLKVGWQVAFELPTYVKPLRANTILKSKHMTWLEPVANAVLAAYRVLGRPHNPRGYEVKVGSAHALLGLPAVKTFLDRWSASVPNHLIKSADFYAWRLAAPGTRYLAFLVYRKGAVVAVAVGRQSRLRGIPCYALLDVMALSGERAALTTLYRRVEREACWCDAEAIVTMMSRYRAREYRLSRFGFLKSSYRFKLIIRALSAKTSTERLAREQDWHLMWIDSDDL